MMDIEKLIEQYRQAADKWEKRNPITGTFCLRVQDALRDAATALSTLQAENEKLRAELEQVKVERDAAVALVHEWEQYGRYLSPMGFTVPPNWKEDLQE